MSTISEPTTQPGARQVVEEAERVARGAAGRGNLALRILFVVLAILKWLAIAVLAVVAAALVLVPLLWGPTPLMVSLLLAAVWVGVVALLVRNGMRWHSRRGEAMMAAGFVALGLASVLISQISAYTPGIVDAQGKPVPGSVASLETVTLGGTEQWITVRGKSTQNPVLLWLAGGPGGSQLATERYHLRALEDHFVVVNWEQPGAGKSYGAVDHATLTTERYISDGLELVQYLRQRFGVEKVYVVGESWGSALGIWLVQRRPELFYAFVGTGQMVDFVETEVSDYHFGIQLAEQRGDTQKVAALQQQGPPPYYDGIGLKQAAYLTDGFAYMNENPAIANDDGFNTFQDILSPEYGLYDKASWVRGILDSCEVMFPQIWKAGVDFRRDAPRLQVPVYFFLGRHDVNAPPAIAEDYYRTLNAPYKELVWFERSGHNPWVSESQRFADEIVSRVLKAPGAQP